MINTRIILLSGIVSLLGFGQAPASDIGQHAPNCRLSGFAEDKDIDIAQYRGDVVYVDFWASWCPPCAKSFGFLNGVHQQFQPHGLKILGVNLDEEPGDAREFLADYPVEFDVLADDHAACAKLFDVKAMPSSYLIDRNGVIRHVHLGFRSGDTEQLKALIEQLLAENRTEPLTYVSPNH
jgi:peroxiredoxin